MNMEVLIAVIAASISLLTSLVTAIVTMFTKKEDNEVNIVTNLTKGQREFADQIMKDNYDLRTRLGEAETKINRSEAKIRRLEAIMRENGIAIPSD